MASRVHPDAPAAEPSAAAPRPRGAEEEPPTVLTVWRKSLLFNCHGFTVFDARGDLAFRVDCYDGSRRCRAEVVLMDAAGAPLLIVRRRRLSLSQHWVIYDCDGDGDASNPLVSVRRCHARHRHAPSSSTTSKQKALAHVTALSPSSALQGAYMVEGSYEQRSVAVRDARGGVPVAEVRRKESVGDEVFRLVVPNPSRLGTTLAMGLIIALDEMVGGPGCGASARSLLPRSWSM